MTDQERAEQLAWELETEQSVSACIDRITDALAAARAGGEGAGREQLQHALDAGLALAAERDRLRAGLSMLAQCRHVSGSAQGAFRSNLAITDAVLAGADVRDFATVDAISRGTWRPAPTAKEQYEVRCSCGKTAILIPGEPWVCLNGAWSYHTDPDESKTGLWNCGEPGHYQAGLRLLAPTAGDGAEGG